VCMYYLLGSKQWILIYMPTIIHTAYDESHSHSSTIVVHTHPASPFYRSFRKNTAWRASEVHRPSTHPISTLTVFEWVGMDRRG